MSATTEMTCAWSKTSAKSNFRWVQNNNYHDILNGDLAYFLDQYDWTHSFLSSYF